MWRHVRQHHINRSRHKCLSRNGRTEQIMFSCEKNAHFQGYSHISRCDPVRRLPDLVEMVFLFFFRLYCDPEQKSFELEKFIGQI